MSAHRCLYERGHHSADQRTFPPKKSVDEVAVLEQKPARPHVELAELQIGDSGLSFGSLQHKILDKAASLGADAVVFAQPQTQTTRQIAYVTCSGKFGPG